MVTASKYILKVFDFGLFLRYENILIEHSVGDRTFKYSLKGLIITCKSDN